MNQPNWIAPTRTHLCVLALLSIAALTLRGADLNAHWQRRAGMAGDSASPTTRTQLSLTALDFRTSASRSSASRYARCPMARLSARSPGTSVGTRILPRTTRMLPNVNRRATLTPIGVQ